MGNPLINELLVGTGFKDRFSMDQPKNDSQFAPFFLDPALARVVNALTGGVVAIPDAAADRPAAGRDLRAADRRAGHAGGAGRRPAAPQHRRRADAAGAPNRLGLLGGDPAGFPNGRRSSTT